MNNLLRFYFNLIQRVQEQLEPTPSCLISECRPLVFEYLIPQAFFASTGNYTCRATNVKGTVEETLVLKVRGKHNTAIME